MFEDYTFCILKGSFTRVQKCVNILLNEKSVTTFYIIDTSDAYVDKAVVGG